MTDGNLFIPFFGEVKSCCSLVPSEYFCSLWFGITLNMAEHSVVHFTGHFWLIGTHLTFNPRQSLWDVLEETLHSS